MNCNRLPRKMSVSVRLCLLSLSLVAFPLCLLPACRADMCSALTTNTGGKDLAALREEAMAAFRSQCRREKGGSSVDEIREPLSSCSISTEPAHPHTFVFPLRVQSAPFRLEFHLRTEFGGAMALAGAETDSSIFAEINIGAARDTRANVRPCHYQQCISLAVEVDKIDQVDEIESRPFWLEYKDGVVYVGQGGQETAYLQWDAQAYHGPLPNPIHVGVASWTSVGADWVLHQSCK